MLALRRFPTVHQCLSSSFHMNLRSNTTKANLDDGTELRDALLTSARATTSASSSHATFCQLVARRLCTAAAPSSLSSSGLASEVNTSSTDIAAFQRRALDCAACRPILHLLSSDRDAQRALPLALLRDLNSKRSSASEVKSIATELMHQIEMFSSLSKGGENGGHLSSNEAQLWRIYAALCGVHASTASIADASQGCGGGPLHAQLHDICFWVREMAAALRRAGDPLSPAQRALGSALPFIQHADTESALTFRRTLSAIYSTESNASTTTYLSPAAKVHFVCAVCVPFALTHFVVSYVGGVRQRLDVKTLVTIVVCAVATYVLVFQKKRNNTVSQSDETKSARGVDADLPGNRGSTSLNSGSTGSVSTIKTSTILSAINEK
ncbi:transmembrane protein, putative [Bodo saltans]|uniref:Transmembrane protein, putative n=1 Tax=Bodo saltans TaxID=75058 RepID=A0A0S4JEQ4_BODSA|nr:transmembrane protein, putative [Bodo saltans]|eukprot:CUG89866.1 transmembrane protein, putative [Bodo saltans]